MSETEAMLKKTNLNDHWSSILANLKDSERRVRLMQDFKTKNGLSVLQYPVGINFVTLEKVCKCVDSAVFTNFNDLVRMSMDISHQKSYHLVRNNTELHKKYETKEKELGSDKIKDIGEFRIVLSDAEGNVEDENRADFSLYITDDTFFI
jgi:hypothetical protein